MAPGTLGDRFSEARREGRWGTCASEGCFLRCAVKPGPDAWAASAGWLAKTRLHSVKHVAEHGRRRTNGALPRGRSNNLMTAAPHARGCCAVVVLHVRAGTGAALSSQILLGVVEASWQAQTNIESASRIKLHRSVLPGDRSFTPALRKLKASRNRSVAQTCILFYSRVSAGLSAAAGTPTVLFSPRWTSSHGLLPPSARLCRGARYRRAVGACIEKAMHGNTPTV